MRLTCGLIDRVAAITRMAHARGRRRRRRSSASSLCGAAAGGWNRPAVVRPPTRRPRPNSSRPPASTCWPSASAMSTSRPAAKAAWICRLLEQIHRRVPVPLVLHGGTGIASDVAASGHRAGSDQGQFRHVSQTAVPEGGAAALGHDCHDPHRLLGMGGPEDVLGGRPPGGARRRARTDRLLGCWQGRVVTSDPICPPFLSSYRGEVGKGDE